MLIRISLLLVSAVLYYFFYILHEPGGLNSGSNPLARAIKENDSSAFYSAIKTEDLELKIGQGSNPLTLAINGVNLAFVEGLLKKGANPNSRTDYSDRPAIYQAAASVCYPGYNRSKDIALDIVKQLIAYGADVNARNIRGETAIMWAAKCGNPKLASLLIDNGAKVNIISSESTVPLHHAIHESRRSKSFETIEVLIAAGANPYIKNSEKEFGKTAIEWAEKYKDTKLRSVLEKSDSETQLEAYTSERTTLTYEARRIESKLYEYGLSVSASRYNFITDNTIIILFLPSFLALLTGMVKKDNFFLIVSAVQTGAIFIGTPILLIIGLFGS
jgi:ankyrin repeat protein